MKGKLSIILALFFLFSCEGKRKISNENYKGYYKEENSSKFNDSLTLVKTGGFSLEIDSVTPHSFSYMQFFEENEKPYISFLNAFNRTIYIYDFNSKQLATKIKLKKRGVNGQALNFEDLGYNIKNSDSIYLCDTWNSDVLLVNKKGEILKHYPLPKFGSDKFTPGPIATTDKPVLFNNNKLYILGDLLTYNVTDHTQIKNAFLLDLNTSKVEKIMPRPQLFNIGTWAGHQFELYADLNRNSGNIVYSFAADPLVYEFNPNNNKLTKHFIGSKFFKIVPPVSDTKLFKNGKDVDIPLLEKHDYTTPQFNKLLYDKYNNLYFRSAMLPLTTEEYQSPNRREIRKETLIIFDEDFKKVGEVSMPISTYSKNMTFITRDGLHIAKLPKLQENERKLTFITYKIEKK